MASASRTKDDLHAGSSHSTEVRKDVGLELLQAEAIQRSTDSLVSFPFSPLQFSPSSVENLYGHPQHISNFGIHDLDSKTNVGDFSKYPMDPAFDQDMAIDDLVPLAGYQDSSFLGRGVNMTMSSGCQTTMMSANQGMNGAHRDRNFIDPNSSVARNFQIVGVAEEPVNIRSLADTNRCVSNFSTAPEIQQKPDFVQRAYDNQVRVNAPQLDRFNKLDGRFLSLGCQSNSVLDGQSDAYGRTSFSRHSQFANDSLNKLSVPLSGFGSNVGGFMTRGYSGDLNLPCGDHSVLQAVNYGFDGRPVPVPPGGEINLQHFIPTPSSKSSGLGNEIGSKFSSNDTSQGYGADLSILSDVSVTNPGLPETIQRMKQRIPFNSSILRSNHQSASDQLQNLLLRTNLELPPFGGNTGETSRQDQSGLLYPANLASNTGADEGFKMFHSRFSQSAGQDYTLDSRHDLNSTGQGVVVTGKSGLPHPSSTPRRESLKRSLPRQFSPQEQQKKFIPQTSTTYPFSPYLLKNALGQIGEPVPAFTSSANPSSIPTLAMKACAASNSTNQITLPASEAFVSPTQIPATYGTSEEISLGFPTFAMSNPTASSNISSIPVVTAENRTHLLPPNAMAASSAFGRTVTDRSCLARVPINTRRSKRVKSPTVSPSPHIRAPATALQKTLSSTSSVVPVPPSAVSSLRKRLPSLAALAKASSAYRAAQISASSSHIKWQGFDTPQPIGEKCLLCKRDLSYSPEGPFSLPPIAPPVAVLPCGHTFHDDCLSRITPADQAKNPPCIPCAIGDK